MQDLLHLQPIIHINGTVNLPGSKSISNRALLIASLANGTTLLTNLLNSDDVNHMLNALNNLGVRYLLSEDRTTCEVIGNNGFFIPSKSLKLFLGNAGTVMRPLTAILSLGKQNTILTGESRMKERPIGHLVSALRDGGAKIDYLENINYPPVHLHGGFVGGEINIDGSISSQFLTSLLIAAPLAKFNTYITIIGNLVSKPYIDITLHLMHCFGVEVENENYKSFIIKGQQKYISPGNYFIEGDASSASYFLAAAAIKGGTVRVTGIDGNSVQGDINFASVLKEMGANIEWGSNYISCTACSLKGIEMDMNHIPDVAMTAAITALFAEGITCINNIYNWRVKETDRLSAMAIELRKIGAIVKEGYDYIHITPPDPFVHANINTYDDHRMAMCFSLVSLSKTSVTIINPKCTIKTFPNYFQEFKKISKYN